QTLPGTFVFGKLTAFKVLPVFAFGNYFNVITQDVLGKFSHPKWIHAVTTFILISVCYVAVFLIDNIGVVIEIGGALTNVP
ncbi:hypothetical protein HZS_4027, partial [Henneguya salminicola]